MKTNQQQLESLLKTTQMGQIGIRSVQKNAIRTGLQDALQHQLQEYDSLESEINALARTQRVQVHSLNPALQKVCSAMVRLRLQSGRTDSQIAGMMIQGNTRGMITGLKNLHQFSGGDGQIRALSEKLLNTETANISQMKQFL